MTLSCRRLKSLLNIYYLDMISFKFGNRKGAKTLLSPAFVVQGLLLSVQFPIYSLEAEAKGAKPSQVKWTAK